ncbi:hypothetical protein QJQ45_005309 [Haematococcus lacustris]|nr:hypothetical protein QJQ45_005309 [Haematococcus lacustris]
MRSKRTQADQHAKPSQPTKGRGRGKTCGSRLLSTTTRQVGGQDCNAALNMQRIEESKWRPLELCWWPDLTALTAKGKEYSGLGYKRLQDRPAESQ